MINLKNYDVIVAGGGVAGVSAALAAARNGASVLLIEKECALGGLATLGLITIFLPLCDGRGNQVVYGIGEELIRLSIKHGSEGRYPDEWLNKDASVQKRESRFEVQYNPNLFAIEMEQLLVKENVDILYDTYIIGTDVDQESKRIQSLKIFNKSGTGTVSGMMYIDCTGDADLCSFCNIPTDTFNDNVPAAWYYFLADGKLNLRILGALDVPERNSKEEIIGEKFSGLDAFENSRVLINNHKTILEDIIRKKDIYKDAVPVNIPSILQIRKTRKLLGEYILEESDREKDLPDSIGLIGDWRKRGPVYQIPYRCLYSSKIQNLAVAGRCISVSDDMWEVTRVIPGCCVTGEAAGTAAAIGVKMNRSFPEVDISLLQDTLHKSNVKFKYSQVF